MIVLVLGLDPTATGSGAAVLRDGPDVCRWWVWTRLKAGWRVRGPGDAYAYMSMEPHLAAVAGRGAHEAGWAAARVLVLEGLEPPRVPGRRSMRSTRELIALAEAAGETLGPLRAWATEVRRPTATEWRRAAGLGALAGDRAEDAAVGVARREGWLPRGLTVEEEGAVAEAGLMASYPGGGVQK